MVQVVFDYKQIQTVIQANLNDSFNTIANKFINETHLNSDEICKEDKIKLTESIESKLLDTQVSIQTFREFINEGITCRYYR